MKSIRVIGIGSPIGDDQIGWVIVDRLRNQMANQSQTEIDFLVLDRPGLNLLSYFEAFSHVIIIDAVVAHGEIGKVHKLTKNDILNATSVLTTHEISVAAALQLGEQLNMLPEFVSLYGIEIAAPQQNSSLSTQLINSMNHSVAVIAREIFNQL